MLAALSGRARGTERAFLLTLFLGLLAFVVAFGPGTSRFMGYAQEEADAAFRAVDLLLAGGPFDREHLGALANRHGVVPVAARMPWALLATPFRGPDGPAESALSTDWSRDELIAEAILSLAPQLECVALVTLLATWILRVTGDRWRTLIVTLAGLFTTYLWPYAYIGMETLPALSFFLAAFLALGPTRLRGFRRDLAFAVVLGVALSAKSSATFLLPVFAWLAWRSACRSRDESGGGRIAPLALALACAIPLRLLTEVALRSYLLRHPILGGSRTFFEALPIYLVDSPARWLAHLHGFLFSANKGWLVFAPLALIGLWRAALGAATATSGPARDAARLALGTFATLALPLSALSIWTDETWGPRYLLVAVPPALLAFALLPLPEGAGLRLRRALLRGAAALGLTVNLLGVLVFYGTLAGTAWNLEPPSLTTYQTDLRWNHPAFNLRILAAWVENLRQPGQPATFSNPVHWWLERAPDARDPPQIRLGASATPQPAALRVLVNGERRTMLPFAWILVGLGLVGAALLAALVRSTRTSRPREAPR